MPSAARGPARFVAPCIVCALLAANVASPQVVTATVESNRDNTLYATADGSLSNGAGSGFFVGQSSAGLTCRGIVGFLLTGSIPPGSYVLSATLNLHVSLWAGAPVSVALHRVLADWGEGSSNADLTGGGGAFGAPSTPGDATWLHRIHPGSSWNVPGGDFHAAPTAVQTVGGDGTHSWTSNQLLADVQAWVDDPLVNFGWILVTPEGPTDLARRFDSRENTSTNFRPQLVVLYTPSPAATAVATGTGCVGSTGMALALGSNGLPILGEPGFAIVVTGGHALAPTFVFWAQGLAIAPVSVGSGCLVYLDPANALAQIGLGVSPFPVTLDGNGAGAIPFPIPFAGYLAGRRFDLQALSLDATPSGFVTSNALTLTIGI
jgi:hypothetical protein